MTNTLALSGLLAALVIAAIGASVLLRDRTRKTYTSFAAFTFVMSAWHLCQFIYKVTLTDWMEWLSLWPAATIPPVALQFFRAFLAEPAIGGQRRPPRVTLIWTIAAAVALLYSALVTPIHNSPYFRIPFGLYIYGSLYRCVWDLYQQYRATSSRVARTRIQYLLLGGLIATTLSLTGSIPLFGEAGPALGNVLTVLYLYFLSQTLFRYRLLDINELVGKMVVLGTLVILLWGVYGLLLAWVGGGGEELFILNALVGSFVILILFEPVRGRLENTINRWIVRQRYELRGRVADVRRRLKEADTIQDMVTMIMDAIQESRRLTHACFFLIDGDGNGYDLIGSHGPQAPPSRLEAGDYRVLLDRVRQGFADREMLGRELRTLDKEEHRRPISQAIRSLAELHATVVVPIFGSAESDQVPWLLGVVGFHDERIEGAFDMDDIDGFKRLADECAKVIESTQMYDRVKERDRLAAIGEMAAGLAHEIRNPLGAIKGAAQLLVGPDGKPIDDFDDAAEWLGIIIEEVDRLNNVVTQFLDYARPERSETSDYAAISVNEVVQRTVQLLENSESEVVIDLSLDESVPDVAGDPEQLRQVFLNLGLNAIQSMQDGGTLTISTTRRRRSSLGYGTFAEIRFQDTGPGITPEARQKLFIPFFTTKERGSGLGLAVSQRIMSQHSGVIEVRSTPGFGSTFSVFLPALPAASMSQPASQDQIKTEQNAGFRKISETRP